MLSWSFRMEGGFSLQAKTVYYAFGIWSAIYRYE